MPLRRATAALTCAAVMFTLAACTSDGDTKSGPTASASVGGEAAALSSTLRKGIGTIASAHFDIDASLSGQPLTGSGVQKVDNGALTGLQADATLPGVGSIGIVVDGDTRYVKLPPPLATAAKPWVKVDASSKNVIVKQLSGVLDAALTAGSLGNLGGLASATRSVTKVGPDEVGGAAATRYKLVVDPAKLPDGLASSAGLGTADIPVDLWLDGSDRPVKVHTALTITGQKAAVTITFDEFGKPVTITAPPAAQVAAD